MEFNNIILKHLKTPEEESEEYCSLIIETGFNIFFLIAQFVEFNGNLRKLCYKYSYSCLDFTDKK